MVSEKNQTSSPGRTDIPWQDERSWQELQLAISVMCSDLGEKDVRIREIAGQIRYGYQQLDNPMNLLCGSSCINCREICCQRATLWYDLPDLLFIYLISAKLPPKQISRVADGACCNLGSTGCVLPRWQRPFICSWYLCGAQQLELRSVPEGDHLKEQIGHLRESRKQLFAHCVEAVSP